MLAAMMGLLGHQLPPGFLTLAVVNDQVQKKQNPLETKFWKVLGWSSPWLLTFQ